MTQRNQKEVENDAESSKKLDSGTKTLQTLKPEPKIAKSSPNPNLAKLKESNSSPNPNKNSPSTNNKEDGNAQSKDQRDQSMLGGLIFMCNRNTKPDIFRYMVMGLPEGRRHVVMGIKPGLNLFLYDYDLKLLHGVYKASSAGGMRLEPSAFNGAYPAQVRFNIHMHCLPLPEGIFKKAIEENYEALNRFKMELTVHQVKKLIELFPLAPQPQPNALIPGPQPVPVQLAPPRPMVPAVGPPRHPHLQILPWSPRAPQLQPNGPQPVPVPFAPPRHVMPNGPQPAPVPFAPPRHVMPAVGAPQHPHPQILAMGPYPPQPQSNGPPLYPGPWLAPLPLPRPVQGFGLPAAEQSSDQTADLLARLSSIPGRGEIEQGGTAEEAGRLAATHAANAVNALSHYNQRPQLPGGKDDLRSVPVSSRYTFDGPTFR